MPPDDPVFFVDADLSDKWFFRALEEAGIAFERHDDHFKSKGMRGGPTAKGTKTVVFTLIQRNGDARSQVVPDVKARTLKGIIRRNVEGTAKIMTDENPSYFGLEKECRSHDTVNHTEEEYVRGIVHVNFSESFFSLLKRAIIGTFHHVSAKHMQRYLEEFDFRWNRRKTTDKERMLECVAGTEGRRLYFKAPKWMATQGA